MNKSDIKIIFVDIDWTIYTSKQGFNMESINALKEAQSNGVKVVIVTARPYSTMYQIGLFDVLTPDGYATNNGASIVVENKTIFAHTFPKEVVKHLYKVMKKRKTTCEVNCLTERYLLDKPTPSMLKLANMFKDEIPPVVKEIPDDVCTLMFFARTRSDKKLQEQLGPDFYLNRFCPIAMDITYQRPIYKSEGVIKVLEYYNLSSSHAMALGDELGDIPMLKAVKYGIAMGNAKQEVKDNALDITDSVIEGGVAKALKKYQII